MSTFLWSEEMILDGFLHLSVFLLWGRAATIGVQSLTSTHVHTFMVPWAYREQHASAHVTPAFHKQPMGRGA